MDEYELQQRLKAIEFELQVNPSRMRAVKQWYRTVVRAHDNNVLVERLFKCDGWDKFAWSIRSEMANDVDAIFIRLMLRLYKDRIGVNPISMHMWWRRMKAMHQFQLLTYLDYTGLVKSLVERYVDHTMILPYCISSRDTLAQLTELLSSNDQLDLTMRAHLGASMATDIPLAWVEWAKDNHPDKGGDSDKFVIVKACYEEWQQNNKGE